MSKRRVFIMAVMFFLLIGTVSGCGKYIVPQSDSQPEQESGYSDDMQEGDQTDPFEEAETIIQYSTEHGAKSPRLNKKEELIPFEYVGGEFSLDYTFNAEAKGKTMGFLLFLDGEPQEYWVYDKQDKGYIHEFDIVENNKNVDFTIHFTPFNRKKGEVINMVIVGIFHPAFQPDMKNTSAYGFYHNMQPCAYQLKMKTDSPAAPESEDRKMVMGNLAAKVDKADRKLLQEELPQIGYGEVTSEMLEENVYYSITYDNQLIFDSLDVTDKRKVHVVYKICGCPGTYRTTFFMNHQPVSETVETKLSKGDAAVLEVDIDTEFLDEDGSFYAITVPDVFERDVSTNVSTSKTSSIFLYKKDGKTTSAPNLEKEKDRFKSIKGKISEVFYGNGADLLIKAGEMLYLYDAKKDKLTAKADLQGFSDFSLQRYDHGYVIVGRREGDGSNQSVENNEFRLSTSETKEWKMLFFDSALSKKEEVNLSKLLGKECDAIDGNGISVSHDGSKIAVIQSNGVILYDVRNTDKRKLLKKRETLGNFVLEPVGIEKIEFTKDDAMLTFFASVLPVDAVEGEEGISAWGTVSLDGKKKSIDGDSSYFAEEMYVYKDNLILPENFEHNSGKLLKVNYKTRKKSFLSFSSENEGKDGVYPSGNGGYFATACLLRHGMVVRVYSIKTGELLQEKKIQNKKEEFFYRIPQIYLVDDTRFCMIVMGAGIDDIKTKIEIFAF